MINISGTYSVLIVKFRNDSRLEIENYASQLFKVTADDNFEIYNSNNKLQSILKTEKVKITIDEKWLFRRENNSYLIMSLKVKSNYKSVMR